MNFLKFTRYREWWEYKLIPLLNVGYATILFYNQDIEKLGLQIIVILFAVIFGAVYVSVINDITDIDDDLSVGKNNRMAKISIFARIVLVIVSLSIGVFFGYIILPDTLALTFFILSYVVFTVYSAPPLRLKKRGFLGVLCDASGAHLLPSLLVASNLPFISDQKINILWMIPISLWALFYGIRGILVHQFHDRENDLKSGTTTFAASVIPSNFKTSETLIFISEIAGLALILFKIFSVWIAIALILYLMLMCGRSFVFKYETSLIMSPVNKPSQLVMNDFYLVFMPLAILFTIAINNSYGWIAFLIHIILFPRQILLVLKDFMLLTKKILNTTI